jgi:hypothetical protein
MRTKRSIALAAASLFLLSAFAFVPGSPVQAGPHAGPGCNVTFQPMFGNVCDHGYLYQVFDDNGQSMGYVHKAHDPPASPGSNVNSGPRDPVCQTTELYYTQLVYAYPSDKSDNSATVVPMIRNAVRMMNGIFYDDAVRTGGTADLIVKCDASGQIDVPTFQLGFVSAAATFGNIKSGLVAAGYNDLKVKYLVLFDDNTAFGTVAGMGQLFPDDSLQVNNMNNGVVTGTPMYAQYYKSPTGGVGTAAFVFAHELGHTLGAVQNSAPNTTGAAHCIDGAAIMCYDDGGPFAGSYTNTDCTGPGISFDCDNDDYFHRCPPVGSYLSTRWNIGHDFNRYFVFNLPTASVPPAPSTLGVTWATFGANLVWTVGYYCHERTYDVYRSMDGGPFNYVGSTPTLTFTDVGLEVCHIYTYYVVAVNKAGVESGPSPMMFGTPTGNCCPEMQLASLEYTVKEGKTLRFSTFASDFEGDMVNFAVQGLPFGATISSSGFFSWPTQTGQAGSYTATLKATDVPVWEPLRACTVTQEILIHVTPVPAKERAAAAPEPDTDGDGVPNGADNCPGIPNADQMDQDRDNLGDACDSTPCGEGQLYTVEAGRIVCPGDKRIIWSEGSLFAAMNDQDRDGILDGADNCPGVANHDQLDMDGDGIGDACDPDLDGDGIANALDNCPRAYNRDQKDSLGTGVGDACSSLVVPAQASRGGDVADVTAKQADARSWQVGFAAFALVLALSIIMMMVGLRKK